MRRATSARRRRGVALDRRTAEEARHGDRIIRRGDKPVWSVPPPPAPVVRAAKANPAPLPKVAPPEIIAKGKTLCGEDEGEGDPARPSGSVASSSSTHSTAAIAAELATITTHSWLRLKAIRRPSRFPTSR